MPSTTFSRPISTQLSFPKPTWKGRNWSGCLESVAGLGVVVCVCFMVCVCLGLYTVTLWINGPRGVTHP